MTLCCGINDNPKLPKDFGGTFCGQLWDTFLAERGISDANLWGKAPTIIYGMQSYFKLYPNTMGLGGIQGINIAMWLMGVWHEGADHN